MGRITASQIPWVPKQYHLPGGADEAQSAECWVTLLHAKAMGWNPSSARTRCGDTWSSGSAWDVWDPVAKQVTLLSRRNDKIRAMLIQGEKDGFFFPGLSYSVTHACDRSLTSWWSQGSTSPGAFLERQKVTFTQDRGPRVSDAREASAGQTNSKIHSFLHT